MSPHYWVEFPAKKVALFSVVTVAIVGFWTTMPPDVQKELFHFRGRFIGNPPFVMFVTWLGGWFVLLFVRAEDVHVTAPVDIQAWCRVVGAVLVLVSGLIAGFYSLSLFI